MPNITFDLKEINGGGAKADEFLEENRRTDHARVPLPQVGEVELEIPPFFITPTRKGWRLVNPLTAVRNLATRRGETAISLARKNVEEPKLNEKEPHPHPQLSSFSVSDRKRIIAYYEAVKRGEHTKYTTKNKPRGFPATLYKNARRAGLTEDPNTKTYRKNATIAKPKAKPPPSPPPSLSNKSSAKSNSTRSLSVSPLPSLPSLAKSSSARARSSSESSIESEVSSASSASSASSKDEKIMETAEQYDFEDIVNILGDNRIDYKIGKRNPDKYFYSRVFGYFPKELYDFDTDMELVSFLNNLQNAVREVIDHIIKNPDKPIDPDYHFTNSWVKLAWESNNHKIPVQLQRYTQHFLTEIGAYKYDDDEDRLIPLKAIKKAIAKFKIVPKEDEDRGTVVINRKGKGLKSESDSDQDKNGSGLFDKIKSFVKPKSKEEKAKKNPAQTLEDSELKDLLNKSYESGLSDYGDYKVDRDLSNPITQVYYHSAKKQPVVVHRGSQDAQDWLENLQYGLNDKSGSHFKKAEETQRKAEEKYGTENLTTIGHSKGSIHAEKFGKRGKQIITLNKPVNVNDLFSKVPENQIDIKTSGDPVSVLRGLQQGNPARVLESKTSNPLLEHQISNLEGLGLMRMRGRGLPQSNRIDFDDMKWGSFTNQFKRFRQTNPHSNIKDLHGFANMIVNNPKHFSHTTFRRASFYLNVILKNKGRGIQYDQYGNYAGRTDNGIHYDQFGNYAGRTESGIKYDQYGNYAGRTENGIHYDNLGNYAGKTQNGIKYDQFGNYAGRE